MRPHRSLVTPLVIAVLCLPVAGQTAADRLRQQQQLAEQQRQQQAEQQRAAQQRAEQQRAEQVCLQQQQQLRDRQREAAAQIQRPPVQNSAPQPPQRQPTYQQPAYQQQPNSPRPVNGPQSLPPGWRDFNAGRPPRTPATPPTQRAKPSPGYSQAMTSNSVGGQPSRPPMSFPGSSTQQQAPSCSPAPSYNQQPNYSQPSNSQVYNSAPPPPRYMPAPVYYVEPSGQPQPLTQQEVIMNRNEQRQQTVQTVVDGVRDILQTIKPNLFTPQPVANGPDPFFDASAQEPLQPLQQEFVQQEFVPQDTVAPIQQIDAGFPPPPVPEGNPNGFANVPQPSFEPQQPAAQPYAVQPVPQPQPQCRKAWVERPFEVTSLGSDDLWLRADVLASLTNSKGESTLRGSFLHVKNGPARRTAFYFGLNGAAGQTLEPGQDVLIPLGTPVTSQMITTKYCID